MVTKKRVSWIDILKGYCMLFVMLHHLSFAPSVYRTFYAPFFLTAFFVSAGLTFSAKRDFKSFVLNKIKTLIIPLFVLDILNILISMVLSSGAVDIISELKGLCIQIGTTHLWFIAAMFVFCIAFYPIAKYCGNNKKQLLITIIVLAVVNIIFSVLTEGVRLPWHINFIGIGCFWLGIGYLLKDYMTKFEAMQLKNKLLMLVGITLAYILVLILACYAGHNYLGFEQVDDSPVLYILTNGLGVAIILILSVITPQFKCVRYIGRNTLFYFAFHGKVQALLLLMIEKINMTEVIEKFYYITPVVFVIIEALILFIPCEIFSKLLPFAVGKGRLKKKD